jgi:hypothetical protein
MTLFFKTQRKDTFLFLLAFITYFTLNMTVVAAPKPAVLEASRYLPPVVTLTQSHDYLKTHAAPTYWKMSPFYIGQHTDSSCSLATATIVVNTAQSGSLIYANHPVATENDILLRTKDKAWADWTKEGGMGVSLNQLKDLLPKALKAYGLKNYKIEVVLVNNNSKEMQAKIHQALMQNEKTGRSFLIANFDHSIFTNSESVGHFSPVAAYDAEKKRVLIMDTFRQEYEPYWISEDLFLKGMMTKDKDADAYRGYLLVSEILVN